MSERQACCVIDADLREKLRELAAVSYAS